MSHLNISELHCRHKVADDWCKGCKGKRPDASFHPAAYWLLDSGASCHFTGELSDFTHYKPIKEKVFAKTANGIAQITGLGTVLLQCVNKHGDEHVVKLSPVLHMPDITAKLISLGKLLLSDYSIRGNKSGIEVYGCGNSIWFAPDPEYNQKTLFGISSIPTIRATYTNFVSKVDYDIMHRRLGHASKEVIRHVRKHMQCFPDIHIPSEDCPCLGCLLGKMANHPFLENEHRATKPFELVHSDLKSFLVLSYQKYKYVMTILDDYTSHTWTILLHTKAVVITAATNFLEMVHTQFDVHVKG